MEYMEKRNIKYSKKMRKKEKKRKKKNIKEDGDKKRLKMKVK
jgi:hypothetical protein